MNSSPILYGIVWRVGRTGRIVIGHSQIVVEFGRGCQRHDERWWLAGGQCETHERIDSAFGEGVFLDSRTGGIERIVEVCLTSTSVFPPTLMPTSPPLRITRKSCDFALARRKIRKETSNLFALSSDGDFRSARDYMIMSSWVIIESAGPSKSFAARRSMVSYSFVKIFPSAESLRIVLRLSPNV
jgi:hypothetical protein